MATYKIPEGNLYRLEEKIAKLSRKASKLGCDTIGLEILSEEIAHYTDDISGEKTYYKLYTVEVTGIAPSLNGWKFVAKLEHLPNGNVVKGYEDVPEIYLEIGPNCDHCQTKRDRINTYVVRKGNTYKQVGSSCVADFTGHPNPQDVASIAEWLRIAVETARENEYDPDRAPSGPSYFRLETYLAFVAMESRNHGYISKSKAHLSPFGVSTGSMAFSSMLNKYRTESPTEKDTEKAQKAIAWIRIQEANGNQYMHNLITICQSDFIEYGHTGFAASLIAAYNREMEKETKQESAPSNWIGTIKKRQMFDNLTVTFVKALPESQWGVSILHKFQDESGNILVWFATNGTEFEIGDIVSGKATVKKHDEYRNVKQTVINRCKFELVEA